MKNEKKKIVLLLALVFLSLSIFASPQKEEINKVETIKEEMVEDLSNQSYGSFGAINYEGEFTLELMLKYSIEDERIALAEYELIMDKFNVTKPFSNIIEAEKRHEQSLLELYSLYGFEVPNFNGSDHVILPESLEEIYKIGVDAEIANIEMYEKFLEYELDAEVAKVFTSLRDGSIKHLEAFQRQVDKYN